jgi:hypothetical protein
MSAGRILVVADYPIGYANGFGETLFNLFTSFPTQNVFCVHPSRNNPVPSKWFGRSVPFDFPQIPAWAPRVGRNAFYPYLKWRQHAARARLVSQLHALTRQMAITHMLAIPVSPWVLDAAIKTCIACPRIKLVTFVMDDWKGHHTIFGLPYSARRKRLLSDAFCLSQTRFAISREMAELYQEEYGLSWEVVHNGIPVDAIGKTSCARSRRSRIVLTGDVNVFRFDAVYSFALAVDRYNARSQAPLRFDILGEIATDCLGKLKALQCVRLLGRQPQDQCFKAMREADFLYLPLAFLPTAHRIAHYSLPTKLPEYLMTGRPIIFHAPAKSALMRVAERNELEPTLATLDAEEIDKFVDTIATHKTTFADWPRRAQNTLTKEFDIRGLATRFQHAFEMQD